MSWRERARLSLVVGGLCFSASVFAECHPSAVGNRYLSSASNHVSRGPDRSKLDKPLYSTDGLSLVAVPFDIESLAIADGVTNICENACRNCRRLSSVVVPASVRSIGAGAFDECPSLKAILFEGDAPKPRLEAAFGRPVRLCVRDGARGWDDNCLGALVVRMKGGFDYKRECSLPFVFGEMTDVGKTGWSALASDWQLPDFAFGEDCPLPAVPGMNREEVRRSVCPGGQLPVYDGKPLLDLGIHRVVCDAKRDIFRHIWFRNEIRYPIGREERIAEYEAIKTAVKERYGVLGTETRRKAFFAEQWKTTFETDEIRIEVTVDPDGLCRPLTVIATDIQLEKGLRGDDVRYKRYDRADDSGRFFARTPLSDYLRSVEKGGFCPSRWPFDGLPFGKHIDTLGWKRVETKANGEVIAEETCDGLGFAFTALSAYADKESGRIFRFVAAEDLSLADYSNICQTVSRHYGTKGVEDNEYWKTYPDDVLLRGVGGGTNTVTVPVRLRTEFSLPNQVIRLEYAADMIEPRYREGKFSIEVDDIAGFNVLREEFRKRFENDRLEKFSFGEIRRDVDDLDFSEGESPRLVKPFRLFGRERVKVTPTTHRVWKKIWESDPFPSWMTPTDVSNELHCLEKELVRLYGGSPTQEWVHTELHAGGCTFRYGTGASMFMEVSHCLGDERNKMVLSVSDDTLAAAYEDEKFIHGYKMDRFVFGRNPPKIRVGVGTRYDFESPVKRWSGRTETITNTDIVCRHVWTHETNQFYAVGCGHLGDVGAGMLEATYRRSKIVIGNTYGVTNPQESVTTNGVVETSVARFRKDPVTVTLTMRREISGKEKVRSLTIVGEMDEAPLVKAVEADPSAKTFGVDTGVMTGNESQWVVPDEDEWQSLPVSHD